MTRIPTAWFGRNMNGLADPQRMTAEERRAKSPARAAVQRIRRQSPTPAVRRLQAAADRALGGR
jgi:hypothetical protein